MTYRASELDFLKSLKAAGERPRGEEETLSRQERALELGMAIAFSRVAGGPIGGKRDRSLPGRRVISFSQSKKLTKE